MLTIYQRTMKEPELRTLSEPVKGAWIYAENPTDEELKRLEALGFDRDILVDAKDYYEVPRLEHEKKTTYFFTRFPYLENDQVMTAPIMIAVGKDLVLTIAYREPPFLKTLLESNTEFFTTQKTKLFLLLAAEINRGYAAYLTEIRRGVNRARANIRTIRNRDLVLFVDFENTLNDFITSLVPTRAALETILSGKYLALYEYDADLIEDLKLETTQLIESCKSNLKTIQNIRSAYSTIMTNRLNQTIKVLTALTIILTIPTIIASLYGMNVPLPLADHPYAFWIVSLLAALLMSLVAYVFARSEWI